MRVLLIAVVMLNMGWALGGCSHTYNGAEQYGEQMPQYRYDEDNPLPAYMHPNDGDENSP